MFIKIWTWIENIAYAVMKFIMEKVLRRTYQDVQHDAIMQFVKFGIVGVSNTVISYFFICGNVIDFTDGMSFTENRLFVCTDCCVYLKCTMGILLG